MQSPGRLDFYEVQQRLGVKLVRIDGTNTGSWASRLDDFVPMLDGYYRNGKATSCAVKLRPEHLQPWT